MDTLYGNRGRGNHIWNHKQKQKTYVRLYILDKGYPLKNEGIA